VIVGHGFDDDDGGMPQPRGHHADRQHQRKGVEAQRKVTAASGRQHMKKKSKKI
jgi:hypothetical protein